MRESERGETTQNGKGTFRLRAGSEGGAGNKGPGAKIPPFLNGTTEASALLLKLIPWNHPFTNRLCLHITENSHFFPALDTVGRSFAERKANHHVAGPQAPAAHKAPSVSELHKGAERARLQASNTSPMSALAAHLSFLWVLKALLASRNNGVYLQMPNKITPR